MTFAPGPVAYDDAGWAMALGHQLVVALRTATRDRQSTVSSIG